MLMMALGLVETGNEESPTNQTLVEDTQKISTNLDDGTLHHQDAPDLVWTFVTKQLSPLVAGQCHSTYSLQPLYYHLGCAFFLLAFLAPSHRYGAALYARCMLVFGSILFAMWSYLTECRPDVLLWSAIFIIANLIHMVILICKLRPVKFEKEIEEVSLWKCRDIFGACSALSGSRGRTMKQRNYFAIDFQAEGK
jgi:hypothetical protein